jgi:hypothetical protein
LLNKIWTWGRVPAAAIVVALMFASACESKDSKSVEKSQRDTVEEENRAASTGFGRVVKSQQIPVFDFSQEREALINVLTMRAEGTHGTASAYTLNGDLLWWCETQGAPVPSTYQLTPSEQYVDIKGDDTKHKFPVDQGEQTGVYTGDSAATWTVCLDDRGTPFAQYEEANVRWTGGVVHGLDPEKRASIDEATFEFEAKD